MPRHNDPAPSYDELFQTDASTVRYLVYLLSYANRMFFSSSLPTPKLTTTSSRVQPAIATAMMAPQT
jgi:hypothetical protein